MSFQMLLLVQLASAGHLEVTCLATVVTNGFFMETLAAMCPFFLNCDT